MPAVNYAVSLSCGSFALHRHATRSADHPNYYEIALPAAKTATDWVKTSASIAACNLPAGHGYANGNFDVYWSGGLRYSVPGTIAGNALSLNGGAGDDFPANGASCIVCRQVAVNTQIDGDAVKILGVELHYEDADAIGLGHVDMVDSAPVTIEEIDLAANKPEVWDIDGGDTNVFTGNPIVSTKASHNDTTAAATLKILSLEDSTP